MRSFKRWPDNLSYSPNNAFVYRTTIYNILDHFPKLSSCLIRNNQTTDTIRLIDLLILRDVGPPAAMSSHGRARTTDCSLLLWRTRGLYASLIALDLGATLSTDTLFLLSGCSEVESQVVDHRSNNRFFPRRLHVQNLKIEFLLDVHRRFCNNGLSRGFMAG